MRKIGLCMVQDIDSRRTEFAVFCIENTAERLGISGREVVDELDKTDGVEEFLYPSYEALHTQGKDYVVDEVLAYIHRSNPMFGVDCRKSSNGISDDRRGWQ